MERSKCVPPINILQQTALPPRLLENLKHPNPPTRNFIQGKFFICLISVEIHTFFKVPGEVEVPAVEKKKHWLLEMCLGSLSCWKVWWPWGLICQQKAVYSVKWPGISGNGTRSRLPVPATEKQPQIMKDPPPFLTVGWYSSGLSDARRTIGPDSSSLVSSVRRSVSQNSVVLRKFLLAYSSRPLMLSYSCLWSTCTSLHQVFL